MSSRRLVGNPRIAGEETVKKTKPLLPFLRRFAGALVFLCVGGSQLHAADSNPRVEAILVWATHVAKTNDTNLKELEPNLAKKLSKRFKWNLYYEVRRKEATVTGKDATKVPISEKCMLEIKHLGEERFEVQLIGKGKPVSRSIESLAHGHLMIVGGDDKNDTAWLILIREMPSGKK